jgi:hypothetical protein
MLDIDICIALIKRQPPELIAQLKKQPRSNRQALR